MRRLSRRLGEEHGISLLMAIITMAVLSTVGGGVAVYTSSNLRHSYTDQSSASAYRLAEAGLAEAISKLHQADDPTVATLLSPATVVQYPSMGGTATYSGTAAAEGNDDILWTVTSTGSVGNPAKKVTLKQAVKALPTVPGASLGSWSRFYQDDASSCLTIDTVAMPSPIATQGDLCLVNGGSITGANTSVEVGGGVRVTGVKYDTGQDAATSSGTSWSNPTYVFADDSNYATYNVGSNATSNVLTVRNFGFNIPSTAAILGISVYIQRYASTSNRLRDAVVQLQKTSGLVGSNKALTSTYWGSSSTTKQYGDTDDLWNATLTPADINSSNFGVQISTKNYTSTSTTANLDHVYIYVRYATDVTKGVGTSTQSIAKAMIGTNCQYQLNPLHNPCTSADRVYATNVTMGTLDDPDLVLPKPAIGKWYEDARPGPNHPCTNANNNFSPLVFDNPGDHTQNDSLQFDNSGTYDITPTARDYDCQYVDPTSGLLLGRISWNHTTHVLLVGGTIMFDGDVRFDDDGQLVHYQGRAMIYAAGDIEFDELVCAGGTGTSQSCVNSMSVWDPSKNYLVLQAAGNSEYDQGGASCSNMPAGETCNGVHPQSGFQGVVSAQGTCTIHERFYLSGPVLCNQISLPYESDGWPTIYAFPSLTDLIDGQQYGNIDDADGWVISPGATSAG